MSVKSYTAENVEAQFAIHARGETHPFQRVEVTFLGWQHLKHRKKALEKSPQDSCNFFWFQLQSE